MHRDGRPGRGYVGRPGEGQLRAEFEKAAWQKKEGRAGGLVGLGRQGRETVDGEQRGCVTW